MAGQVIAIGLDAAGPEIIEAWMEQGHLKTLRRLRDSGTYCRLAGLDYATAEATWTAVFTGMPPQKTGFWTQLPFNPGNYEIEKLATYKYDEYPPFYAAGDKFRVAAIDIPQVRLTDNVNGVQVLSYGAHSPQSPRISQPEDLLSRLIEEYGDHPAAGKDYACLWDRGSMARLKDRTIEGAARRGRICRDMLASERWDLFLTVFSEIHSAAHYFWHLSQPDHPLHEVYAGQLGSGDPLLEVCEAVDAAVGEIISAAPKDARIVVFSQEGLGPNNVDLPLLFLPELLYRWNFPGKFGFDFGSTTTDAPPPAMITQPFWPPSWSRGILPWFNLKAPPNIGANGDSMFRIQIPYWYKEYWPKMKAFALPSFSHGYVRINLRGREAQGIVEPDDYDATCEEISEQLRALTNPRTGKPLVQEIIRTRPKAGGNDSTKFDGDLVVVWESDPADVVDSPVFGRIGPVPLKRSCAHTPHSFVMAAGPGIASGSELPATNIYDLAPTILNLMEAPIPDYLEGKPLKLN